MTELKAKIDEPRSQHPIPHAQYKVEVLRGRKGDYKVDLTGSDFTVFITKLGLERYKNYEEKIKNLISKALKEEKGFLVFDNRSCDGGSWIANRITLYFDYTNLAE